MKNHPERKPLKPGDRVCLSQHAIDRCIHKSKRCGVLIRFVKGIYPLVRWDGYKSLNEYHVNFIEPEKFSDDALNEIIRIVKES